MSNSREDLAVIIRADATQLQSDLARTAASFRSFAAQIDRASPKTVATDAHAASLKASAKAAGEAKASYAGAASGIASFAAKAAIAGGSLLALEVGFTGVSSAIEIVKSSVQMAAEVEQTTIAFETMLGSVEKTATVMADLRKFAADTPFSNKEVVAGARQLLAYGVAADQLIPTLKLVGTLSAGTSTPLSENVYRYGTTKVQGVAHQIDLNQLANAGIDVYPGLAKALKIDQSQIRKYTEEGRVDFNAYQAALIDLGQTRFSGLLDRQAKSLKGAFEQLGDAWDMAKLKLGQVIIRETGLHKISKDAESFANTIGKIFDSPEFSKGVRFASDLTKGVAQLVYEFSRLSYIAAPVFIESFAKANPGIERTASAIHDIIKDAQNFKFDDEKLVSAAFNFIDEFTIGLDLIGRRIEKNIIKPIEDSLRKVAAVNAFIDSPLGTTNAAIIAKANANLKALFPTEKPMLAEKPVAGDTTDKEFLAEYKRLKDNAIRTDLETLKPTATAKQQVEADDARKAYQKFLQQFKLAPGQMERDLEQQFEKGIVPQRIASPLFPAPLAPPVRPVVESDDQKEDRLRAEAIRKGNQPYRDLMLQRIREDKASRSAGRARDILGPSLPAFEQMGLTPALGPFGALAPALPLAGKGADWPRPDNAISPRLIEMADKLNDKFYPLKHLTDELADLNKLRDLKLISPDVYAKGKDNVVRDVAERLGIGGETKLPGAAMVGSAEDAKLLAQFRAGMSGASATDALLAQILEVLRRDSQNGVRDLAGEVSKLFRPVNVNP